jgi:hypothetical protein
MSVENNKNPTICIVRASDMENEKHEGIDIMKWDAENLSHYNLKEEIEPYLDFIRVKNIHELFMFINVYLQPNDKYMINIEDLFYTADYVYQAIFKLPIKEGTYNQLINDSNKLATQMLHEKHIVDGNMIIIKRSIINNDFDYLDINMDDITDILRTQFMHNACIIRSDNTMSVQQYIHDAFEINFGQSHLDNCRSHELKLLDYRLFFHIDRKAERIDANLNKYASIIFGKKIYGNCLVSLCDNDDSSPKPLDIDYVLFLQIYYLALKNLLEKTEIDRKKYTRKINLDNRNLEDADIYTDYFKHNNFPEITLCPNFFYIIKKEYANIDKKQYENIDKNQLEEIYNKMSILNDVE